MFRYDSSQSEVTLKNGKEQSHTQHNTRIQKHDIPKLANSHTDYFNTRRNYWIKRTSREEENDSKRLNQNMISLEDSTLTICEKVLGPVLFSQRSWSWKKICSDSSGFNFTLQLAYHSTNFMKSRSKYLLQIEL